MEVSGQPSSRDDFHIAIICALRIESDAVEALFDTVWDDIAYGRAEGDYNAYITGRIGNHNAVLTFLPGIGKSSAAGVAANFRSSFKNIRLGLVVGICGAIPFLSRDKKEIILGDVIISTGIIQYDFGRQLPDRVARKDTIEDVPGRQNVEIRSFLAKLQGLRTRKQLKDDLITYLLELSHTTGLEQARYPGAENDILFESNYRHKHHREASCEICAKCETEEDEVCDRSLGLDCTEAECRGNRTILRERLKSSKPDDEVNGITSLEIAPQDQRPEIHFGCVASGDQIMRSGCHRDTIAQHEGIIAFEMEGAGVWDQFPTIIIKGVCDYADSHKNKKWQTYAAASAASCMKALLKLWHGKKRTMGIESIPEQVPALANENQKQAITTFEKKATELILKNLKFELSEHREALIEDVYANTYQWLLNGTLEETGDERGSGFVEWLRDDTDKLYWITGKPGSGKSTLMKNIANDPRLVSNLNLWKREEKLIIATFYFYDRGVSELQKSQTGLLRSILFQICSQKRDITLNSFPSIRQRLLESDLKDSLLTFTLETLIRSFKLVLRHASRRFKLFLHIDGLDEYSPYEDSNQRMTSETRQSISWQEQKEQGYTNLAELFVEVARLPHVKVCVSSRPLQRFFDAFEDQTHLRLETLTAGDIKKYIDGRFTKYPLTQKVFKYKMERVRRLANHLVHKACGVFLWIKIVMNQVIYGLHNREDFDKIEERVHSMPVELGGPDGLYMNVFMSLGSSRLLKALDLIRLVLSAKHVGCPISPLLLYFLDAKQDGNSNGGETEYMTVEKREDHAQMMRERVRSLTAGLLEDTPIMLSSHRRPPRLLDQELSQENNFSEIRLMHLTLAEFLQENTTSQALKDLTTNPQNKTSLYFHPLGRLLTYVKLATGSLRCLEVLGKIQKPLHRSHSLIWGSIKTIISCIRKIEQCKYAEGQNLSYEALQEISEGSAKHSVPLLDELNRIATRIFASHLYTSSHFGHPSGRHVSLSDPREDQNRRKPLPVSHWVQTEQRNLISEQDILRSNSDFLSFCFRKEFYGFVFTKLTENPSLLADKMGEPLLYQNCNRSIAFKPKDMICSCGSQLLDDFGSGNILLGETGYDGGPSEDIQEFHGAAKHLLELGADPNQHWNLQFPRHFGNTPWTLAITYFESHKYQSTAGQLPPFDFFEYAFSELRTHKLWFEHIKMFLEHGADAHKPIVIPSDRRTSSIKDGHKILRPGIHEAVSIYSSLFFVASSLSDFPEIRKELMQLLAKKGAKFVQGDVRELMNLWKIPSQELIGFDSRNYFVNEAEELIVESVETADRIADAETCATLDLEDREEMEYNRRKAWMRI